MTRVVNERPPIYDAIIARFGRVPRGTVFAWSGVVYDPDGNGRALPAHLLAHEETHFRQQASAGGAAAWWERYLSDDRFRLEQEIEAYREQWHAIRDSEHDRHARRRLLAAIVRDLASGMYGRFLTKEQARRLITEAATA